MKRWCKNLTRGPLLDHAPGVEHHHTISETGHSGEVMADENKGDRQLLLEAL